MYDTPYVRLTHDQADEVVVQHLKGYLGTCMDFLERLYTNRDWTDAQYRDFHDNLQSAKALVVVLQDHTIGLDFTRVVVDLNKYEDYLLNLV